MFKSTDRMKFRPNMISLVPILVYCCKVAVGNIRYSVNTLVILIPMSVLSLDLCSKGWKDNKLLLVSSNYSTIIKGLYFNYINIIRVYYLLNLV